MYTICSQLILNSIYWVKQVDDPPVIRMTYASRESRGRRRGTPFEIVVTDNGRESSERDAPFIFELGYTTKVMGMVLVLHRREA